MKAPRSDDPREHWRRELRETPECIAIERIGEELTAREREHISHCARCESELALWEEFRDAIPSLEEGGAVQWVAAETARRRAAHPASSPQPGAWRRWLGEWRPQALAAAATVVVAVGTIGYVVWDREPSVVIPAANPSAYRSERIEVISPTGDLPSPPAVFHWVAVPGAESYDVAVLEVDRAVLWRGSTREPHVEPAGTAIARFAPGKTILWEVTARRGDGTVLAQSGVQRFRVAVKPRQGA